jgi:ribosome-associated toxin RatA of RatAB toxin-antitoxin module
MKRVHRSAIVECAPEAFYDLVMDIESYPDFLPWCEAARILERAEDRLIAGMTLGYRGIRQSLTTRNTLEAGRAMDMTLVEGPFRKFHARWHFLPLGEAACKAEFTLEYEFASATLGRLLGPLFERIADTIVEAFMRRRETLSRP